MAVEPKDFDAAIDRVIAGLEKKSKVLSPREKEIVAYHEAGHALVGWLLPFADPVLKVRSLDRPLFIEARYLSFLVVNLLLDSLNSCPRRDIFTARNICTTEFACSSLVEPPNMYALGPIRSHRS